MDYTTHSKETIEHLLDKIGKSSIQELFASIPESIKAKHPPFDKPGSTEQDLLEYFSKLSQKNNICNSVFIGGGAYNHYAPSVINHIISRAEFQTAYTPYQAEVSQGTLQTIFEFQSIMADLTGMEISNASMYDGASSAAEAVLMAHRLSKRKKSEFLISKFMHPEYIETIRTYTHHLGLKMRFMDIDKDGRISEDFLKNTDWDNIFAVIYQSPNFYGILEDHQMISSYVRDIERAYSICIINEISSLGILEPPGAFGIDITAGEAQALGLPLSYGGPYLGFLATKLDYVREVPGRLVGATNDADGNRGFVLTLATREQHIRRENATSNICTNQALCALSALIYIAMLGNNGLYDASYQSFQKAGYLRELLASVPGINIPYKGAIYNEFVYSTGDKDASAVIEAMEKRGVYAGIPLSKFDRSAGNLILTAVTENNTAEEIEYYASCLKEVLQ